MMFKKIYKILRRISPRNPPSQFEEFSAHSLEGFVVQKRFADTNECQTATSTGEAFAWQLQ